MEWLLAFAVIALGGFLWYMRRSFLRMRYAIAAGYAGYSVESLYAGNIPSCQEVIAGIRAQPERFAQRAQFLALNLAAALPETDHSFLLECLGKFNAFIVAFESGQNTRNQRQALYLLGKQALEVSHAKECPAQLAQSLQKWSLDIVWFIDVVRSALPGAKRCNCAPRRR
jgi:hypothetical protein